MMKTPKPKGSPSKRRQSATKSKSSPKAGAKAKPGASGAVVLLSGGNPQIAKADGNAPVQAYIAAMPGWQRDMGNPRERWDLVNYVLSVARRPPCEPGGVSRDRGSMRISRPAANT